jgi:hypothetical protein
MTRTINGSIINQPISRASAAVGATGPTLLTDAELGRVAAAGSKPGGTTDGRDLPGSPLMRSA